MFHTAQDVVGPFQSRPQFELLYRLSQGIHEHGAVDMSRRLSPLWQCYKQSAEEIARPRVDRPSRRTE